MIDESTADAPEVTEVRSGSDMGPTVLVSCGFMVLLGLYLQTVSLPGAGAGRLILADLAFMIPLAFATVIGLMAISRSRGDDARVWRTITVTNAILFAAEVHYVLWIARTGAPPDAIEWSFQALHVAGALSFLAIVGVLTPLASGRWLARVRWYLEIAGMSVVLYIAGLFLLVKPLFEAVSGSVPADALVGAVYPTWGLLVVGGLVWAVWQTGWSSTPLWRRLVMVSVSLYALGISAWPLWYSWIDDPDGSLQRRALDLVLILSHYLMVIAAAKRVMDREGAPPSRVEVGSGSNRKLAYMALGIVMLAMPAMTGLAIVAPADSLDRAVYIWGAGILAVLAVARTVVVAVEGGRLFSHSVTDPLTGLYNHRYFHERLAACLDLAKRSGDPVAIIVVDIDDFDAVNDRHGHPMGDQVLKGVAVAIQASCDGDDVACRLGGDEFAVILPGSDAADALRVSLRIHHLVRLVTAPDGRETTLSSGIAVHPVHACLPEELIKLADGASYWAKDHGKDQTLVYDPHVVKELGPEESIRALEQKSQLGTVRALAAAVDSRYEWTHMHSHRVAALSVGLARRLGVDEARIKHLEMAALLHDVGIVAVSDGDFSVEGPLDARQAERIRRHPELGAQMLGAIVPDSVLASVRHHEEHWDGSGYPDGLRAVNIPLEARIIALCGSWDAMLAARPHRPPMSPIDAAQELRDNAGTQFDPSLVEVFLTSLDADGD